MVGAERISYSGQKREGQRRAVRLVTERKVISERVEVEDVCTALESGGRSFEARLRSSTHVSISSDPARQLLLLFDWGTGTDQA